jgi:dsDNA-specific endonuclease/ATPase MutS2
VITGHNTGGKTVVLKPVGLLTLMIQSGLHVPADKGSQLAVFSDILADIGDGQSIEQSLSTFSSHIRNIINIVAGAGPETLVIMDELGAGTDPGEGMGLAIAVLEDVYAKGAVTLATTHFSEIKEFAREKAGFINGCMEFNIDTLRPLYRLRIGMAGESNAFLIALRLGMNSEIIEKAHEITYKEKKSYSSYKADSLKASYSQRTAQPAASQAVNPEKALSVPSSSAVHAAQQEKAQSFKIGDCVHISSMGRTGIVCELENSKGDIGVMVMKKKLKINKKRLSLYIEGSSLYPENYDFDVIFESKDNRKKERVMSRRHVKGLEIRLSDTNPRNNLQ